MEKDTKLPKKILQLVSGVVKYIDEVDSKASTLKNGKPDAVSNLKTFKDV